MEQPTKRKLAAILMADVVGYSVLMSLDEAGPVHSMPNPNSVSRDS